MKIGDYKIYSISWGTFRLDGGAMFGVVPKTLWDKKIPAFEDNTITMQARGLLLKSNDRNILIDTGIGTKENDFFNDRYTVKDTLPAYKILHKFSLAPEDITDVFITHLHFDHCGGATILEKNQAVPTFKNATYYIQKKQWDSAFSKNSRDSASFFHRNYESLQKNNLKLLEGPQKKILNNIDIKITNGHTLNQQHPLISDEKTKLFYCADIFPTSAHIPPKWVMAYDNKPETSIMEKNELIETAVKENWILFFEHDPKIKACRITKEHNKIKITETIDI